MPRAAAMGMRIFRMQGKHVICRSYASVPLHGVALVMIKRGVTCDHLEARPRRLTLRCGRWNRCRVSLIAHTSSEKTRTQPIFLAARCQRLFEAFGCAS